MERWITQHQSVAKAHQRLPAYSTIAYTDPHLHAIARTLFQFPKCEKEANKYKRMVNFKSFNFFSLFIALLIQRNKQNIVVSLLLSYGGGVPPPKVMR